MNSKIGLIIGREYLSRVKKSSFIILTLLMPFLIIAMALVPALLAMIKEDGVKQVSVVDQTGLYSEVFKGNDEFLFNYLDDPTLSQMELTKEENSDYAFVLITDNLLEHPNALNIYSTKQVSMDFKKVVREQMESYLHNQKLTSYNIPNIKQMIEEANIDLDIDTILLNDDGGEKKSSTEISSVIGMLFTFAIYMFLFIYGAQVMQSVTQEKSSRIMEVMASSVRPFDLMFGKIVAIGLVGLTQITIWIELLSSAALYMGAAFSIGSLASGGAEMATTVAATGGGEMEIVAKIMELLGGINFSVLIVGFIADFIAGYLLYASLFAAIGAAVDNETDTQQFMMPITILIIFAMYAGMYSINNPDGPLAFWCSLFPFTSPIVMMVRLPFGVPFWQISLSMVLLVATALGCIWGSGRIYRVGILMYGKKPSFKELAKWMRYK